MTRADAPESELEGAPLFSLILTVKRGSACGVAGAWNTYPTLAAARHAAAEMRRHERVQRVMIVRNGVPQTFVEWADT